VQHVILQEVFVCHVAGEGRYKHTGTCCLFTSYAAVLTADEGLGFMVWGLDSQVLGNSPCSCLLMHRINHGSHVSHNVTCACC